MVLLVKVKRTQVKSLGFNRYHRQNPGKLNSPLIEFAQINILVVLEERVGMGQRYRFPTGANNFPETGDTFSATIGSNTRLL